MTDQNEEYTQDTSQDQNTGGPEIPKTPETPKIGERVRNFFGGNKREEKPKQKTPKQEAPKQEQPKPRKYKDIWSMYETDAYDENVPWQKEVKERMQADPEFKERWGKFNGWFSSGVKGNPIGYSKIKEFNEDRSDEEKNWRRYKKAYGLSQDDDIDFGTDDYDRPIADEKGFKDLFEYNKDPTAAYSQDFGRDGFNDFWNTRGRYNKLNTTKYGIHADDPTYNDWYWSRNPFRRFSYKSSTRADATDDDRKLEELSELLDGNKWGAGSARSTRLTNRGEFDDISANLYQAKRVRDIFGDEEDPDFFKFMDTIRDSEDPKDRALYDLYWRRGMPGMPSEKDYDRMKENYYHYREQQHGVGRDGKPINPQQETPQEQPGPAQEPQKTEAAEAPEEGVQATVGGKPANAEIVTENNRLPATGREGVQEMPQDVTQYKEPRETYEEPDDHPGPYTGAPKELGAGPEQETGDGAVPAPALGAAGPPGGGKEPADEDDDDKDKGTFQAQYDLKAERNALAKQHATKFLNAFAQTAAEMGGQMASKGWDLAGNIVKMTFTQPHAMSSTSRMIGTAMSALQTAGDFADRSVQKYGIDVNADPNLMKNTIRYKLYKREAEMGKNTVGNTFRTISESLGNMGLQDASQMTPDQLDQHVQDMRAEADRLTQALKDPKLSNSERSLIKAQAQHLQGYMDGLAKQGAGMAQGQRIAARRQKRQDLATRRQNYQVLADGSPNPYREALEWADPRFGIEVDPQTGRPTNPSAYNRMLNAVITQHQNEVAAAARAEKKLDPAREKWFNDLQNKIYNDIQAMKQDKAENPLRGRAEIYARIGRVAPGFEKYIDNIEKTGTFPSNSTQSTRAMRKVLSDYLFELKDAGKEGSPEYNHAKALLTSMDKYNNMKKLMSRIAGVMPDGADRARRIHEATENDPYVKEDFSDDGKIQDYMKLVEAYAHLMERLHRDPVKGGNFNPEDKEYQHYEGIFNDNLTYFVNKWFPGAGWGKGGEEEGGDAGGTPGGGTPGGTPSLDDFFSDDEEEDDGGSVPPGGASPEEQIDPESGDDMDQFIAEALRRIGMGEPFEEETPQPENPNPAPQPPPEGPSPQPPSQQDQDFNAKFGKWKDIKEFLYERGLIQKASDRLSVAEYNALRDEFIKQGVSPEVFDNSGFAKKHLPIVMLPQREQAMIGMNGLSKKNLAWKKNSAKMFDENPDVEALVAKKVRGEPVTSEEELKIQQTMVDYGIINSIRIKKTPKGDVPPGQEQSETPIEGEAEQPQLPAVTENDFIKPEVASQFKDAKNIESINAGIAAIQSLNRDERAGGYNDILWGLENEVGKEALFADKDYFNLVKTAFMDGSPRAIGLVADAFPDPKDKLQALMAGRMAAPKSNESAKMLADFLNEYGKDYDVGAINTIINNTGSLVQQAQSDKGREKIINNFLDNDLDGSVFNHKEGEKSGDETPSEEEAVDPAKFAEEVVGSLDPSLFPSGETDETPVGPESTDQFEAPSDEKPLETTDSFEESPEEKINTKLKEKIAKQDEDIKFAHANLPMPEGKDMNGLVKDLLSEFNVKKGGLGQKSQPKTIRSRIGTWLEKNGYLEEGTSDKPQNHKVIDGLFAMMCRNGLQETLKKTDADPSPEGKRDDTDEGKALREEAEQKKAVEALIQRVGPQGDVDDPSDLQKEMEGILSKMKSKDLASGYRAKFDEAVGKRKISNIGKGAFKSPDPSKWLDEIKATEDAAELERMKGAYEKYIQTSDEKVRKKMQERLDGAYADSEVHKVADKIVDRLVDRILSHSSLTDFEDNKDEYQKEFDKSLVDLSDEKKDERKKLWKDRLMAASDAKKAIANHFPDVDAKDLVGEDKAKLIQRLPAEVLKKYEGSDPNEGPNALDAYKKILKFAYPGSDVDEMTAKLMERIEKVVKPLVNKSLSVRDLFRARNPDWE